jgi:deoxyribonuclease V
MQLEIAEKASFENDFNFDIDEELTVVGIDQGFTENKSVSCVVAMKNGEVIETVSAAEDTPIPYIPALLTFREGKSIFKALQKLETEPDLLMLDGSGRIHFRQAGITTHIGVIFDKPAIGVAKSLLCGEADLPEKMVQGDKRKIYSDKLIENLSHREVIGHTYQSKQYSSPKRSIDPVYISPGHRTNPDTSVELVSDYCKGYNLSEPVRIAHKEISKTKEKYRET